MKRPLVFTLAACAALPLFGADLTIEEAIAQALKANPAVRNAVLESSKLDERRAGLKTKLLPNAQIYALAAQPLSPFSFTVTKGSLGTDSGGAPLPASDSKFQNSSRPIAALTVTVTEPLSLIPSIRRGVRIVDIQKELAEEQTRLERQTLVRDVRQLYYGIQSLRSALRAAREEVKLSEEIVRITSEYAARRQVLDVDYLEAQMHLARFNEAVLDLESQLETLKSKLNREMGRDVLTEFTVPELADSAELQSPPAKDLAEARRLALEQRPEIRQASLRVQQSRLELSNTAASFNPTIAAEYLGIELVNVTPLLPRSIGVAGASLTWEPFTWGRRKHELAIRQDEIEQAANREKDAAAQVQIEVTEQYRRVELAAAKLRVANLTRQMATESLRISQKQYEAQYSLLKTVLQAQAALENADADYRRTAGELWTARAEYDRALGEDR